MAISSISSVSSGISSIESGVKSNVIGIVQHEKKAAPVNGTGFQDFLTEALTKVNEQQNAVSQLSEQMLVDPDSVNVADVTTAMAKASLSLNLAQEVITRTTNAWSEITTTR
ncbi:MAG: hypothetical protein Ta2A_09200 [Treponemataceae bacterium]|nr:MAG: hypothetical protein Ta2A_09200 [Treponemataceae bacterium]